MRIRPIHLKIALLCALFVGFGNVRAGVVGISPATSPPTNTAATTQSFTFNTTGLGGSKITGIGFYGFSNAASTSILGCDLGGALTQSGTFNVLANTVGEENGIAWGGGTGALALTASSTFTISINFASSGLTAGSFRQMGSVNYAVAAGITNYWANPVKNADTDMGVYLYYSAASVPEPATMILTGSALAAGAIGAYFKRRRKPQTEIAA